jgi:hypothetical protein
MSQPVSFDARISIPQDVLHQELDGESVILNVESGHYFGLDAVGSRMWSALSQAESIEQACKVLLAEFDVEEQKLRSDLGRLIGELLDHGLLKIEERQDLAGNTPAQ